MLTDVLGFTHEGGGEYRLQGERAPLPLGLRPGAAGRRPPGRGHACTTSPGPRRDEDHLAWQERIADADGYVTDVRDRDYFRSIYFREPRGVLFEIATLSPGFAVDEDPEHLGEALQPPGPARAPARAARARADAGRQPARARAAVA